MKIRLATSTVQSDSIVDGEGIRGVIWTQGCSHHCPGCHNPETHSFQKGIFIDVDTIKNQIKNLEKHDGITFSGGDPMEQPAACAELAKYCKDLHLNVWCYTGYTFEELIEKSRHIKAIMEFLQYIDVLVDGKFVLAEKSYDVAFRGSKNQRLIDVKESLKQNKVIEINKYNTILKNKTNKTKIYI